MSMKFLVGTDIVVSELDALDVNNAFLILRLFKDSKVPARDPTFSG